ncbi:MAG: LTA synthase family protein [Lachnospiraceae bacterium]|nr:LTA synthase family protein [Lachnospiraceae bacterium]
MTTIKGFLAGAWERIRSLPFLRLFLIPAAVFWGEVFLIVFTGGNAFRGFFFRLFFAFGAGVILTALTAVFSEKVNRILMTVFLIISGILFATECMIGSVYQTYMTLGTVIRSAGNVTGGYGGEVFRTVLVGFPKIVVFFLPAVLWIIWLRKKTDMRPMGALVPVICGMAGIALFANTAGFAEYGAQRTAYAAPFDFDHATGTFGLVASTERDVHFAIFGEGTADFAAETEEGSSPFGPASGDALPASVTPSPEETPETTPEPSASPSSESSAEESSESKPEETPTPEPTPTPTPEPVYEPNVMEIDFGSALSSSDSVRSVTEYISAQTPTMKNRYTGIFSGKNLIIITAESFTDSFLDPEFTPTMWRLFHNGIYFSEYYQPEYGGSTTTGEVSFLLGLAPNWGAESMEGTAGHNLYFTLGNQMQRLGYSSIALHGGYYQFYRRDLTHENLGYNQFVSNETGIIPLCGYKYPPDTVLFENTVDLYINEAPFSVYYMTASGHAAYTPDKGVIARHYADVDAFYGDRYKTVTKYFIASQMELEDALTILIDRLEEAGIADDTVIVMTGDHYPYGLGTGEAWGNGQDYIADLLGHSDSLPWERDQNGLVIWSGCLENELKDYAVEVSKPVYSLDVVPTLSNLFGLEYDSRLLPGRDVFAGPEGLVFWNSGCWVTEYGYYDVYDDRFYERLLTTDGEGNIVPQTELVGMKPVSLKGEGKTASQRTADVNAYIDRVSEKVRNRRLMSQTILSSDYYRILFGVDKVTFAGKKLFNG